MLCTNFRFGMRQIICTHPALVIFIELIHRTKKLIATPAHPPEIITFRRLVCLPFARALNLQALEQRTQIGHSERSGPDRRFSLLRSCEGVGLRSRESLFDSSRSVDRHTSISGPNRQPHSNRLSPLSRFIV
jgi:hypothetical protein